MTDTNNLAPPSNDDYNGWADFWRYKIGVNVIPADTKNKKTLISWLEWQNKPIPEEVHDKWKSENAFSNGMAIIPGKVWHNQDKSGLYFTFIDLDTKRAIEEICTRDGKMTSLHEMAQKFIVEQHKDDPSKAHIYFYSQIPFVKKSADAATGIEVKGLGEHGIAYCSPSIHQNKNPNDEDEYRYEIMDTTQPITLTVEQAKDFMQHLDNICKKHNVEYLEKHRKNQLDSDSKIHKGTRHDSMISIANSLLFRYGGNGKSEQELKNIFTGINDARCEPPLEASEITRIWEDSVAYCHRIKTTKKEHQQTQQPQSDFVSELMERFIFKTLSDESVSNLEIVWYNPNDGLYHGGGEVKVREALEEISQGKITEHERSEIIHHIKYSTLVDRDRFDSNPDIIHFSNGYYNVVTKEFREGHTPDYLSMIAIPHKYDSKAKCHKINKFLTEVLPGHVIKRVVKMWGYCLLRTCEYQKAFMLYGPGRNGKGVVIQLTIAGLGENNCSSVSLQDMCNHRFSTQRLDGKMANTYGDLPQEPIKDASKFKSLVSGNDSLDAEQKFHDPYTFKNKAKLIFSANHIPETDDKSYGYYRRWMLIHFERVFDDVDEIKGLGDKLTSDEEEMSGWVNLALIGLDILRREGGFEQIPYEKIREEYENGVKSNGVETFLNEDYIIDPMNKGFETKCKDLFEQYDKYCGRKGISLQDRASEKDIGSVLTLMGCAHKNLMRNHERAYYYVGLKLKSEVYKDQEIFRLQ